MLSERKDCNSSANAWQRGLLTTIYDDLPVSGRERYSSILLNAMKLSAAAVLFFFSSVAGIHYRNVCVTDHAILC